MVTDRGLSGVDMAILVVAANDGVMPQTLDHLEVPTWFPSVPENSVSSIPVSERSALRKSRRSSITCTPGESSSGSMTSAISPPRAFEEIKKRVGEKILEAGSLILDDLKDSIGHGRTRAIPVLEYLDDIGFTVRMGDGRVLKSPDTSPVEENLNREEEIMDGLNIRGDDEFDQAVDQ